MSQLETDTCDCYNERVSTYTGSISGNPQVNVDKIHSCPTHAAAPETAAERDRLREVNAELLAAAKAIASPMREWLENKPQDQVISIEVTSTALHLLLAAVDHATEGG